ncbi:hypothetical protein G6F68_010039 [Rhizopus microsporus]|nr:hypothetical protein G6F68_010039 [Rhizopus microsporus]
MDSFIHEDGKGNMLDDQGNEVFTVDMEVDDETYPLENVTDLNHYLDLKPPERVKQEKEKKLSEKPDKNQISEKGKKTYRRYKPEDKEQFFFLIYEKNMDIREAARALKMPETTAQSWYKKESENPEEEIGRKKGSGRPVGRPSALREEHEQFLKELIDDKPSLVLEEMMDSLTSKFVDLSISKTALYNFVTKKCRISLKKAHFHSVERNSPEKIQERYDWVVRWSETDLDFTSNCIFIDEAAFHVNMKRSVAWSKKGSRAVVVVPKTRAKTTTILGAISPYGVVNIKVRRPKAPIPSKKRKAAGSTQNTQNTKGGTVTGHYFNFIASTLDILDQHEQFKGNYIVMDNAPIHKNADIRKYIEQRGYGCVYLPAYSPELNPIEQFWSACKSKLKREELLQEETMSSRIGDACNKVLLSDLQGFCRYSATRFEDCLSRKPM